MNAAQELELRMAEPTGGDGTVVRLKVEYPESPRTFAYVGIHFDGLWYLSSIAGMYAKSWDDTITFFKNKGIEVLELHTATAWENLL